MAKGMGSELEQVSDLDAPEQFTDRSLAFLDSALRCPVCGEHFDAPVILTNCSHSFCSLCVRQALIVHKHCPQCRAETDEGRMRSNSALADIVKAWQRARSTLLTLQSFSEAASTSTLPNPSSSKRPRPDSSNSDGEDVSAATAGKGKGYATRSRGKGKEKEVMEVDESSDIEIMDDPPASTAVKTRSANGKAKSRKVKVEDPADPNLTVSCPICAGSFRNAELNRHLDKCNGVPPPPTAGGESKSTWGDLFHSGPKSTQKKKDKEKEKSSDPRLPDTTKPLPLTSYSGLSVRELQKKLTDIGVPTNLPKNLPTDQMTYLRRRHQQFITLFNSNADKPLEHAMHRSHAVLVKDLLKWEKIADKPAGADIEGIRTNDFDREAYQAAHSTDFQALIKQAKAAAAAKKAALEEQRREEELQDELGELQQESQEVSRSQQARTDRGTESTSDAAVQTEEGGAGTERPPKSSVRFAEPVQVEEVEETLEATLPATRSTPPISSPTPRAGDAQPISRSPSPTGSLPSSRASSPLEPPPDWLARQEVEKAEAEAEAQRRSKREFSPYDPRPPRPSQRIKEEEGLAHEEEEEIDEEAMGEEE